MTTYTVTEAMDFLARLSSGRFKIAPADMWARMQRDLEEQHAHRERLSRQAGADARSEAADMSRGALCADCDGPVDRRWRMTPRCEACARARLRARSAASERARYAADPEGVKARHREWNAAHPEGRAQHVRRSQIRAGRQTLISRFTRKVITRARRELARRIEADMEWGYCALVLAIARVPLARAIAPEDDASRGWMGEGRYLPAGAVNVNEAARLLEVSTTIVRNRIRDGLLSARRVNGMWLLEETEVLGLPGKEPPDSLRIPEVMAELEVAYSTVQRLISTGRLPATAYIGKWYVSRADLDRYKAAEQAYRHKATDERPHADWQPLELKASSPFGRLAEVVQKTREYA